MDAIRAIRYARNAFRGMRTAFPHRPLLWQADRSVRFVLWQWLHYSMVQNAVRFGDRKRLSERVSKTELLPLVEHLKGTERGCVLVTPHFGPFVPLAVALAEELSKYKRINFLFADPTRNKSNVKFDTLFRQLPGCRVLYDDRKSIISAIRALRQGEMVTMMPDVFSADGTVVYIPFFSRTIRANLGTAFLAEKGAADLIVVLSRFCFRSFGKLSITFSMRTPMTVADYAGYGSLLRHQVMLAIFSAIEKEVATRPEFWSYWDSTDVLLSKQWKSDGTSDLLDELRVLSRTLGGGALVACNALISRCEEAIHGGRECS